MEQPHELQTYKILAGGFSFEGYLVPEHTQGALLRYFENRFSPGSFGTAMLAGDLKTAEMRADHWNKKCIKEIDRWIKEQLPEECHGSYEKVHAWCNQR